MQRNFAIITIACAVSLVVSSAFAHQWCWTCNQCNTYGWQLMTPEERKEHQVKLTGFTEYSNCKEYLDTQHKEMEKRARGKGIQLPAMEQNPCDEMKGKGLLK